ncbi:hypothetical protein MCHI_003457 [Candidatus Magnetoovum chiemensis]|nr:hypothetical protein MCHI_003457 [Candidatus Magnetoovum chiemensis]
MEKSAREIITPHRKIPLKIPAGMSAVEFFNSASNLRNLAQENGLLTTPEGFLMYRKLLGHSLEFDTSIILDTSQEILAPLGRPVRRDELTQQQKKVWNRMSKAIFEYMLEKYPDPEKSLILLGEASLDATWPLSKPGVPSIRMIHNHFIVFKKDDLKKAKPADPSNPNLTDAGHHSLFLTHLSDIYHRFLLECTDLKVLEPISTDKSQIKLTGYPQGLPSWEVKGGAEELAKPTFWNEYDDILRGFLDFYRTFFSQVSTRGAPISKEAYFPNQIENILLFNNKFFQVAKVIRDKIKSDPQFANEIRWRPAYKQLLYRDDEGRLIATISQNSVGNAITELLGIVVTRQQDDEAYTKAEKPLIDKLLEVRQRLIDADLGEPVSAPCWPNGEFVPYNPNSLALRRDINER